MRTRTRRPQQIRRRRARRLFRNHPRIVSLFSGYGGLDLGVQSVIGGEVIAHVEFEDAPSRVLEHHWPGVPNLGDVTAVDWSAFITAHPELGYLERGYRPGLVITGGFPCQDVSLAGLRRGLKDGTRSGLWTEFARAIDKLRPELVVIENVRGLLSAAADRQMESDPWGLGDRHDGPALRALGAVLGDLAELGYDAEWCGLRAADAGAPHGRFRVFVVAHPAHAGSGGREWRTDQRGAGWNTAFGGEAIGHAGHGSASRSAAHTAEFRRAGHRDARTGGAGSSDDDRAAQDAAVESRPERGVTAPGQAEGRRAWSDIGRRGGASAADSEHSELARERSEQSGRAAAPRGGSSPAADPDHATDYGQRSRTRPPFGDDVAAADANNDGGRAGGEIGSPLERAAPAGDRPGGREWGPYGAAVERWERVTGRVAPAPTNPDGRDGAHRLAPEFVEWMMGLPTGHVTGAPITRAQQLKALGNGVVPQQAALAVRALLERGSVQA